MIYDITRPLFPGTAVFPGDAPVSLIETMAMRRGDACNVTALTLSAHAGTHVDAPRHCADGSLGVDALALDALVGPARVVSLAAHGAITLDSIQALPLEGVLRLLLHTPASDIPNDVLPTEFAYLAPEAADWLGCRGIRLIGTDAPSVDEASSVELPVHHVFLSQGTVIVENLCLRGVPDGDYELIALPLKLVGGDGAPARVILRTL